ncbi:MAG: putative ParB-like nuclease, partial [Pseudomonadota bacterium]
GNDNYRSLIKLIEDSNCNKKHVLIDTDNTTPYLEFYWADRLRNLHNVYDNLDATNASTYAIDAYNYIVKQQSLFKDLPGFDPVKLSNLCTNFN